MIVNKNETIYLWDVDKTLITDCSSTDLHSVYVNYYGQKKWVRPLNRHISLLKSHKARGFFIRVHSGNGNEWAEAVIKALHLEEYVDAVESKPRGYVDDVECSKWMGERIYLEDERW